MPGTCHQCGAALPERVGFRAACEGCQAYLHACRNCRLYSPSAHNHCLSSTTEFVRDAAAGNFCEEFDPAPRKADDRPPPRAAFDALFGD